MRRFNLKNGNDYSGYTVSVGGDAPDYQDKSAVNVLYPPPPNAPPPPPPPQVDCDGFNNWNACLHGSGHPCC